MFSYYFCLMIEGSGSEPGYISTIFEEITYLLTRKCCSEHAYFLLPVFFACKWWFTKLFFCIFSMEEPGLPADVSGGAFLQAFHGSQAGYLHHFLFTFQRENFDMFCKVKGTVLRDRFRKCWRKWTDLGLNKGRVWFLNFLEAPLIFNWNKTSFFR